MAELTLKFRERLDCGKCDDVVLSLHDPTLTTTQGRTINASIKDFIIVGSCDYQYTISYDEAVLVNPSVLLKECDVKRVCCAGCIVDYVNDRLAAESDWVVDSESVTQEIDEEAGLVHISVTIIDRVSNTSVGTLNFSIPYNTENTDTNLALDTTQITTNINTTTKVFELTLPVTDRVNGGVVEARTIDLSALYTNDFDLIAIANYFSVRDNDVNPAIKEIVAGVGTLDEDVVGAIDTSSFVTGFDVTNCVLNFTNAAGNTGAMFDFSRFVSSVAPSQGNPDIIEFTTCDGTLVASIDITGGGGAFACADLLTSLSIRNSSGNAAIKELVACAGTGDEGVIGSIDLSGLASSILEVTSDCGTTVEFRDSANTLLYSLKQTDKRRVAHTAHALGSANDLVPVKPSGTPGLYQAATFANPADTASHVALVIDPNNYFLLDSGFYVVPSHGYVVNALYSASVTGFTPTANLSAADIVQNAFVPQSANCLHINLQEALIPPQACCASIVDATGDAVMLAALAGIGTNGTLIVTPDAGATSGYKPAVAEDGVIFAAEPYDLDNDLTPDAFMLKMSGCLPDAVAPTSSAMVAIPQSQVDTGGDKGTLSTISSLLETDSLVSIGNTTPDGCLHINIGHTQVPNVVTLQPDYVEAFTGGSLDNTYSGNISDLLFQQAGDGKYIGYKAHNCAVPATGSQVGDLDVVSTNHLRAEWIFGYENFNFLQGSNTDFGRLFTNVGGTVDIQWNRTFGGGTPGQFRFQMTGQTDIESGIVPVSGKLYRVTMECRLNTADNSSDGYLLLKVDELTGDIANGSNLQLVTNLFTHEDLTYNSNIGSSPVNFDRIRAIFLNTRSDWVCTNAGNPAYLGLLRMYGYDLS